MTDSYSARCLASGETRATRWSRAPNRRMGRKRITVTDLYSVRLLASIWGACNTVVESNKQEGG